MSDEMRATIKCFKIVAVAAVLMTAAICTACCVCHYLDIVKARGVEPVVTRYADAQR